MMSGPKSAFPVRTGEGKNDFEYHVSARISGNVGKIPNVATIASGGGTYEIQHNDASSAGDGVGLGDVPTRLVSYSRHRDGWVASDVSSNIR